MPPALQIDIPPQQAQHILEKRHELGPYIFREAQVLASHVRVEHLQTFFSCMCASSYSSLPVDVSVWWITEVLARVSGAYQQHPRGATYSSAAGETSQAQSQSKETEKEGGRGGGREKQRKEESPGEEMTATQHKNLWGEKKT